MQESDTIVAISTPPGRGGIGIVRLSGCEAKRIAEPMLRLRHPLVAGHARFARLLDPESGLYIDEAVVTYFQAPHSYTGEDVVEIAAHGAPVILNFIVQLALDAGALLASPGEFTQRAFLHGRVDLTQAEAVRDLIEAQTLYQARVAAQQLEGSLSRRIQPIKHSLIDIIAVLEAGIDFAEDDIDVIAKEDLQERLSMLRARAQPVADSFQCGRIVHSGLTLAIVGRANTGKSSLFNRLVERERAIVTAQPGTTRDLVTERVSLGGIPLDLVDTAGLRETLDEAERIGIQKSREALADADVVVCVLDAARGISVEEQGVLHELQLRRAIVAINKVLVPDRSRILEAEVLALGIPGNDPMDGGRAEDNLQSRHFRVVSTSALTGEGIEDLKGEILALAGSGSADLETGMITNLRQAQAIQGALASLDAAGRAVEQEIPHEMVLLDLYGALKQLDALTGDTATDDILNLIFSSFCIGK